MTSKTRRLIDFACFAAIVGMVVMTVSWLTITTVDQHYELALARTDFFKPVHSAPPGASCRRISETVERAKNGTPLDPCDIRNLMEQVQEVEYLQELERREGGWCWDELEQCEAGVATERACAGFGMSRFDALIDDIDACARAAGR